MARSLALTCNTLLILAVLSVAQSFVVPPRITCGNSGGNNGNSSGNVSLFADDTWFVNDEPIVIELASYAGCSIILNTSANRILAFQHVEGTMGELIGLITIQDGVFDEDADESYGKQLSMLEKAINTVYTTGNTALLTISDAIPIEAHLSIQKAVACPFSLGGETQCGRAYDPVSCYCAVYTKRSWQDQRAYCQSKNFSIATIETPEEENAIYATWGRDLSFWVSLNDINSEGLWKWESTGALLYPGYANWHQGQPNNGGCNGNEDCVALNYNGGGWEDADCVAVKDAICELRP